MKSSKLPIEIQDKVNSIFELNNFHSPYILFRTCRAKFGDESPDNLLPSQRNPEKRNGWTVYLDFHDDNIALDNLNCLISFPDDRENELPELKNPRLGGKKKADLSKLPKEFVFRRLNDLESYLHNYSKL